MEFFVLFSPSLILITLVFAITLVNILQRWPNLCRFVVGLAILKVLVVLGVSQYSLKCRTYDKEL
ncbi:hypothetical protein Hanom_Chr17g01547191 [Helianthus anomalus]